MISPELPQGMIHLQTPATIPLFQCTVLRKVRTTNGGPPYNQWLFPVCTARGYKVDSTIFLTNRTGIPKKKTPNAEAAMRPKPVPNSVLVGVDFQ